MRALVTCVKQTKGSMIKRSMLYFYPARGIALTIRVIGSKEMITVHTKQEF